MNKLKSGLELPAKASRKPQKTEILWGGEGGGSRYFPRDMQTIHTRRYSANPKPLNAFRQAVQEAVKRVWIMDEYFLMPDKGRSDDRILVILDWLHDGLVASDIRILTRKHEEIDEQTMLELFQEREEVINNRQARRPKRCCLQVNTCLTERFDYVHDRFAIIDDELWHFGATVGGFHTSVNAASRGWCAAESGAIDFFELAWGKCKERQ